MQSSHHIFATPKYINKKGISISHHLNHTTQGFATFLSS